MDGVTLIRLGANPRLDKHTSVILLDDRKGVQRMDSLHPLPKTFISYYLPHSINCSIIVRSEGRQARHLQLSSQNVKGMGKDEGRCPRHGAAEKFTESEVCF